MKSSYYDICLPFEDGHIIFNSITRRFFRVSDRNKDAFLEILSAPDRYRDKYESFLKKMKALTKLMKNCLLAIVVMFPLLAFGQVDSLSAMKDSVQVMTDSIYKNVEMEGVTVTSSSVTHHTNRDSWVITDEMRRNTVNTFDVIKKLPGVFFDPIKESLSYYGSQKVMLLIDGQERETAYIGRLSNQRFKRIEVYTRPPARYRDYDVVIDVRTKERWNGYDLSLPVRLRWHPSQPSGDKLSECSTGFSFTYTTPVFNIATWYDYGHTNEVVATETNLKIADNVEMRNEEGENSKGDLANKHTVVVAADYKPDNFNTLRWAGRFRTNNNNGRSYNRYQRMVDRHETSVVSQSIVDDWQSDDYLSQLTYMGRFKKWTVDCSALYGFFQDDRVHATSIAGLSSYTDRYKIRRNMSVFKSAATYKPSANDEIEIGGEENLLWVRTAKQGEEVFSKNDRQQTKAFANYVHVFGKSLSLGGNVEYNHISNKAGQGIGFHENYINYAAELSFVKGNDLRIRALYSNRSTLPLLYQRLNIDGQTDTLLYYSGNPELRSERTERWLASINAGPAYVATSLIQSHNKIVSYFDFSSPNVIQTYKNAKLRGYELVLGFFPDPLKWKDYSLSFRSAVFYHWQEVKYRDVRNKCSYWTGYGTILLNNDRWGGLNLTYSRQNNRVLMPQGKILNLDNTWSLTAWHLFVKQNISLSLLYVLPIAWGVEKSSYQKFSMPFYTFDQSIHNYQRLKNSILLTATFHLAKGRQVRRAQQLGGIENGTHEIYH